MNFRVGAQGEFHGMRWRVVQGRKAANDLRLEVFVPQWTPVSMKFNFLCADFYRQNEETLQTQGAIGRRAGVHPGDRFMGFMSGAMRLGWEDAAAQLDFEREEAAKRRAA